MNLTVVIDGVAMPFWIGDHAGAMHTQWHHGHQIEVRVDAPPPHVGGAPIPPAIPAPIASQPAIPAPVINVDVPKAAAPVINVDLKPIAEVLERAFEQTTMAILQVAENLEQREETVSGPNQDVVRRAIERRSRRVTRPVGEVD